ncbi:hypothetical protein HELRODRAFT_190783 [Helobdella robusta]|uniref:SEC7 domain-containing protein n=1 Tax=Helobdella robusta TaxID=6412 RepID=T1FSA5_HELRO|nr:hypothetical protein HELRODRAFT_190783 [Helobdella robusta]ESO08602.1 hypothetical protein HELRODRAFT_190783 [Helobdella robusta]
MGQMLRRVQELEKEVGSKNHISNSHVSICKKFPDLTQLPPEISLLVLSNLNATDLCLAACVWQDLGNDEILWHSLCRNQWQMVSAYKKVMDGTFSYKKLYMQLDEATLTFNADPNLGIEYLLKNKLVDDDPYEIACYLHTCRNIDIEKKRLYVSKRPDVLDEIMKLQNFENQFLPNALRRFFRETATPGERNDYLSMLVKKFVQRFCVCNPQLQLSQDTLYVVCFSLIMLSVDLTSPQIKNKMSKREFIRNVRRAVMNGVDDEFVGHLYDNVYLVGHVAPKAS